MIAHTTSIVIMSLLVGILVSAGGLCESKKYEIAGTFSTDGLCESSTNKISKKETSLRFLSAILLSKNLQGLVNENLMPRDLMKSKMMDKSWTGEGIFEKMTPMAGLFQQKETKEIFFETKQKSWKESEILEYMDYSTEEEMFEILEYGYLEKINLQNLVRGKNWNNLFFEIHNPQKRSSLLRMEFAAALAEIVGVDARSPTTSKTVLMTAIGRSNEKAFDILLTRKAGVDLKDSSGWTALHWAISRNVYMVQRLLESGANIDATTDKLETPLMLAIPEFEMEQFEIVKLLLHTGANPNLRNRSGKTALDKAKFRYNKSLADRCWYPGRYWLVVNLLEKYM